MLIQNFFHSYVDKFLVWQPNHSYCFGRWVEAAWRDYNQPRPWRAAA